MKSAILALAILLGAMATPAQTVNFTWNGSTDASQLINLATINGQPLSPTNGPGAIQIVNGSFMWLLELPDTLGLPNNGFLDCETAIAYGAKQWGIRSDGTTMDGTKAGDTYYITGTTSCPLWNGTTAISITAFREFISHKSCNRGVCKTYLYDTMESGVGAAVVQ